MDMNGYKCSIFWYKGAKHADIAKLSQPFNKKNVIIPKAT